MLEEIKNSFRERFGIEPILVRSPGRINLIGEHTDYNLGYVLPAAIDREIIFALAPSGNNEIILHALDIGEEYQVNLDTLKPLESPMWPNYLLGVVSELQRRGYATGGFYCLFGGDIPIGAGLSSSAAIECGLAVGLDNLFQLGIKKEKIIEIAQQAEHRYTGVLCGIMDQFACTFGKEGHVIRLDCRNLEHEYFPIAMDNYSLVLLDTVVKHSLGSTEYNTRRKECNEGVRIIKQHFPTVNSLRDCTREMVDGLKEELGSVIYNRCLYIVQENSRVVEACNRLSAGDIEGVGKLMNASHEGLSKLYEVSCEELDFIQQHAVATEGVAGARMMGGGFGGCTINLVHDNHVSEFVEYIKNVYFKRYKLTLKPYKVSVSNGVSSLL